MGLCESTWVYVGICRGYVRLCGAIWGYVRLFGDMWGYVGLCWAMWDYVGQFLKRFNLYFCLRVHNVKMHAAPFILVTVIAVLASNSTLDVNNS